MKKYPFLEAIGTADEKFLEEVLNDKKDERGQISMSKKKLVTILIAAALILSLGITAVATDWNRLSQLGGYFDARREATGLTDKLPIIENPEDYAKEITGAVKADATHPAPGIAKITTISGSKHSIFVTIEFNAEGLDLPAVLPEEDNMLSCFEEEVTNFKWSYGRSTGISRNGDIFTYIFGWNGIFDYPNDEVAIELKRFGYYGAEGFALLRDIVVEAKLPLSEIDFMESHESKNKANINGAEFSAELSPYDLVFYSDFDSLFSAGIVNSERIATNNKLGKIFQSGTLELHMIDGSVFTESLFDENHGRCLVESSTTYRDAEAERYAVYWNFGLPIDIDQIEYVVFNDSRFDF